MTSADAGSEPRPSSAATVFHGATLALGALVLGLAARGQWFFGDEWDPIAQRAVTGDAMKSLLEPHNEHWSTVAILVYRAHLAVFGLRTYAPLMVLFVAVCVLTAHLLWRFCLRVGADPWIAAVGALGFLVYAPAGADAVFAWNMTFVGALACGFGILVLMARDGPMSRAERAAIWGLGLLATALSGVGLTVLGVAILCVWWSRGWRVALAAASVPVIGYTAWTLGWGNRDQSLLSTRSLGEVPDAVGTGLTVALDDFARVPYVGMVVLLGLAIWVGCTWRTWAPPRGWALCAALGAVAFYVVVAVRRNSPFLPGPTTGRYLWMAFALLVPLLALGATALARRGPALAVAVGAIGVAVVVVQIGPLHDAARDARSIKQSERRRVVAAARLARRDAPFVSDVLLPTSAFERALTIALVERLDAENKLPDVDPSTADVLGARADLQVGIDASPSRIATPPARLVAVHDLQVTTGRGDCLVTTPSGPDPRLVFRPSGDGPTAALIDASFARAPRVVVTREGIRGPEREVVVFADAPYRLRLAAAPTEVELRLGHTVATVCHVAVAPGLFEP